MNGPTVYLDANATTQVDERVLSGMRPWLQDRFGSASSREHRFGWDAAEAVEEARGAVGSFTGIAPRNVTFTSGATEALNMVLRGYVGVQGRTHKTIVTCATEHQAILATSTFLCSRMDVSLDVLPVDHLGNVDIEVLTATIRSRPGAIVALMAANNEIGTLHPVAQIGAAVHAAAGVFLCDTTQAFGKHPIDLSSNGIDFAAISAHKIHGPQGVGALLTGHLEAPQALEPLLLGGGQERGMRGGTLNVPGIVGLGAACLVAFDQLGDDMARMERLRDRLEERIQSQVPDTWVNGDVGNRLCNTSNIGFKRIDARTLIRDMHDIACSTRSACSSGNTGPSHVLKAIGLSDEDAYSCIRFSLGRFTTEEEIDYTINKVVTSVHKLRRNKSVRI
jgi:cysteine desulfurase